MKKQPRVSKTQSVTPYLLYQDVGKAMKWLSKAFGFMDVGDTYKGEDGTIQHAAMVTADGGDLIMMGFPGPKYRNPRKLGAATQMLYIYVDDVDKHFARAKKLKPKVVNKLEDTFYGDRRYGVEDPEGHQWYFATQVKKMSSEEMKKAAAAR